MNRISVVARSAAAGLGLALLAVEMSLAQVPPANVLVDSVGLEMLTDQLPSNVIRLDYHEERGLLFIMHRNGDIATFDPLTAVFEKVSDGTLLGITEPSGFGISPAGDLYVVGNSRGADEIWVTGSLKRAVLDDSTNAPVSWAAVAETVPYRLSTNYNHLMSSLAVSDDGTWIYINSGARTDHGEIQDNRGAHPGVRDTPLTAAILRVPADADGLILHDNLDSLLAHGYLFADGVRNHFDMATGPNGHLFGVENSGDRDDAEELNWLQEGRHYGFPWRIGTHDNPQQFADYDPQSDPLINPNSAAAQLGLFVNDPTFPPAPELVFVDPIPNAGPDAVEYRDPETGEYLDGAVTGEPVGSFTPHKSPLGLVFDTAGVLAEPYNGDGFLLGWNNADSDLLGPFDDPGQDLLHLDLEYHSGKVESYTMGSTRIADSFMMPIDAVLIDTSLFVMEMRFGCPPTPNPCARMWRLDFPRKSEPDDPGSGVAIEQDRPLDASLEIQTYPNPFSDEFRIHLRSDLAAEGVIHMIDVMGRVVRSRTVRLGPGERVEVFGTAGLASGPYLVRATFDGYVSNAVLTLIR